MSEREFLVLSLDAPLMSFGGVAVDQLGVTERAPTLSMLTGLVGNALGYEHRDGAKLERLQERLAYAARLDRPGRRLVDFQTVDLGQEFLRQGWTTRGKVAGRAGGSAKTGTHIRNRHYWADAVYTVVLELRPADEAPDLDAVEAALLSPARPLFLGRKPCLPAGRLVAKLPRVPAGSLRQALARAPLPPRAEPEEGNFEIWWPRAEGEPEPQGRDDARAVAVTDRRDWHNQVHTGRRFLWHGRLAEEEVPHAPTR